MECAAELNRQFISGFFFFKHSLFDYQILVVASCIFSCSMKSLVP